MMFQKPKMFTHLLISVAIGLLGLCFQCSPNPKAKEATPAENSENAVATPLYSNEQSSSWSSPLLADVSKSGVSEKILEREGYTVSYNTTNRQPNYVAWTLMRGRLYGSAKRCDSFFEDPDLKYSEKSLLTDYRGSGFDRGHMCPAGDNKWSKHAMEECFFLSNMCPQTKTLNAGEWRILEESSRYWAHRHKLHIIAGPYFNKSANRWIKRRLRVPSHFFKAIICLDKGNEKGIAFLFKNDTGGQTVQEAAMPIDQLEKILGYDLFASLPIATQQRLESQCNLKGW